MAAPMQISQVPFTAAYKLFPDRSYGKRHELMRELQRLGWLIQLGLVNVAGLQIAQPGGNAGRGHDITSDIENAVAVKPQMGQYPSLATITGFYTLSAPSAAPTPQFMRFSGGEKMTGAVNQGSPWATAGNPASVESTAFLNEVKTLRTLLDVNVTAAIPNNTIVPKLFRLDYKGILFGDRGYHFPR
jgi:hypothetical protein